MEEKSNEEKPIGERLLGRVVFDVGMSQSIATPQGQCQGK